MPDLRRIAAAYRFDIIDPVEGKAPFRFADYYFRLKDNKSRNNRLMIVHQGHGKAGENMTDNAVSKFVLNGFDVVFCQMPLFGGNRGPALDLPAGAKCVHLGMHSLETPALNPVKFLYGHISTAIEHTRVLNGAEFVDVSMCGISGGGFTTVVYSALDTTIQYSFPVACTMPYCLREGEEQGCFDREGEMSIYDIAPVHVMYALACVRPGDDRSRTQVLMYNMYDRCGPSGEQGLQGVCDRVVTPAVEQLGGEFYTYIDPYSRRHHITHAHLEEMIVHLANRGIDRKQDTRSCGNCFIPGDKWDGRGACTKARLVSPGRRSNCDPGRVLCSADIESSRGER